MPELPCPPEVQIFTLDGEKHQGVNAFIDHLLSKDVTITPDQAAIDDARAKAAGFENVHEAIGSVNKRLGLTGKPGETPDELGKEKKASLSNIVSGIMGNQGLSLMDADIRTKGESVINNIDKATPEQRQKINSDFERLKELHPDKNLILEEKNNSIIIRSSDSSQSETPTVSEIKPALRDVESTAKALEGVKFNANFNLPLEQTKSPKQVSEAYHKAKADGSNPELVASVEDLLGKPKAVTPNVEDWSIDVESTAKALSENTERLSCRLLCWKFYNSRSL